MVRMSATASAGSSVFTSLWTAAASSSGLSLVRRTTEAAATLDCQNGTYTCSCGFSSRLAWRTSVTTPTMVHQVGLGLPSLKWRRFRKVVFLGKYFLEEFRLTMDTNVRPAV